MRKGKKLYAYPHYVARYLLQSDAGNYIITRLLRRPSDEDECIRSLIVEELKAVITAVEFITFCASPVRRMRGQGVWHERTDKNVVIDFGLEGNM